MENNVQKPLTQRMIDGLRAAAIELEEFQLDLALGKAEARDKYEQAKRQLKNSMHEAKDWVNEQEHEIQILLRDLQDKLSEQKASTVKELQEQKEKIEELIRKTEEIARAKGGKIFSGDKLEHELEKFKIKLDMIPVQFALMKMEGKYEASQLRKRIKNKLEDIEDTLRDESNDLEKDLKKAYQRLKEAF